MEHPVEQADLLCETEQTVACADDAHMAKAQAEGKAETEKETHATKYFYIQNTFVTIAALLFVASMLPASLTGSVHSALKTVAYLFGAFAYGAEILALTNRFTKKIAKHELFMPCVFGVLYILLGISYLGH